MRSLLRLAVVSVVLLFGDQVLCASQPPSVRLDSTTFVGKVVTDFSTNVEQFLGIPYGEAPRYAKPLPAFPYLKSAVVSASSFGPSCVQQSASGSFVPPDFLLQQPATVADFGATLSILVPTGEFDEDCLSVNVFVPSGPIPTTGLPIVAWIHGGGLYFGGSSTYDGGAIVSRSVELNQPIIFVSFNYRLGAYGFLGSKEIKTAGVTNLGLRDQRLALQWINKYINKFGGNPAQVTIWGESAGSISVFNHLLLNGGKTNGLFRGAFMESGTFNPVGDVTIRQDDYNQLAQRAGCPTGPASLPCLQHLPFPQLQAAVNGTPIQLATHRTLNLLWQPRVDGDLLLDTPQNLIRQGKVANVPFVNGDMDDEGTLFALPLADITDDAGVKSYLQNFAFIGSSNVTAAAVAAMYSQDPTLGSPYDTGTANQGTPQYKRLASFQGDYGFQAERRFFLSNRHGLNPGWSYLNKNLKSIPFLGSCHGTELQQIFSRTALQDYLIHFVHGLDPNSGSTLPAWPQYTTSTKKMLTLFENGTFGITIDNYRAAAMNLVNQVSEQFPM